MIRDTEQTAAQVTPDSQPFEVLLDQLAEVIQSGDDEKLEAFFEAHPDDETRLRQMLSPLRALAVLDTSQELPGNGDPTTADATLGDFRILHEIGRGGMGVVYEAQQISLPRRVAIKVLPFAAVLDPRQLERFKNEARSAATLEHPGIVSIYAVGCERGVHFFAMQFVEGQSLAEVIVDLQCGGPAEQAEASKSVSALMGLTEEFVPKSNEPTLPPIDKETIEVAHDHTDKYRTPASSSTGRSASSKDLTHKQVFFRYVARLGAQTAEALDHAHTRGIIHRDVKPGNLMLDAEGKIHVADFGLARIEADTGITMTGDILGTLRYMSPEQALSKRAVIDHRTDIYSLGATLYELLTLTPPFAGSDRQELLRKIAFEEPLAPRKHNARVPIDLETIVLKAISKSPTDRYTTAQEMADDLCRFHDGQPVRARRIRPTERLWRWSKRNPIVATLTAAVATLVTLVAVVASIGYARTNVALTQVSVERREAQQERDEAFQNLYVAHMRMAQKDLEDGQIARLQKTLLGYLPAPRESDLRGWEWYYHLSRSSGELKTLRGPDNAYVRSIVWSPDGTSLATAHFTGTSKLWNLETGEVVETIPHRGFFGCLFAWHPGDRRLAWRVDDNENAIVVQHGESRVTIQLDATPTSSAEHIVAWSPDGNRLASDGANNTVIIWDAKTGTRLRDLMGQNTVAVRLSWSPDGKQLAAAGSNPGTITIWDVETGEITTTLESGQFNFCIDWSPDSTRLAVGTFYGNAYVWDVASGEKVLSLSESGGVRAIEWSPNGSQIATGIGGGNITLWDAASGKILRTIRHGSQIHELAWSPDGKWIASGDRNGAVKIWDVAADRGVRTIAEDAEHGGIAFSPDDQRLAYWAVGQTIKVCDVETGKELHALLGPVGNGLYPVWSSDGKHLACGGDDGSIVVCDLEKDEVRSWQHKGGKTPVWVEGDVNVAWHPDGRQLASISQKEQAVRIWDISTGEELSSFEAGGGPPGKGSNSSVAWSPDGERLATGGWWKTEIWDRVGWRRVHLIHTGSKHLAWSRDGQYLVSAVPWGPITISDTFTGRPVRTLTGHTSTARIAGWSADGRRIATVGKDGVRMWNPQTGQELFSLRDAKAMAWSHDRKRIATITAGKVRIYDASIGYKLATDPSYQRQHAVALLNDADSLAQNGDYQNALDKLDLALRLAPEDTLVQSVAAWYMASFADTSFRDVDRALESARRATASSPEDSFALLALGSAEYRKGNWQASLTALKRSGEVPVARRSSRGFYLAMAHWQLGQKEEAHQWFDRSVEWLNKTYGWADSAFRLHDEAAKLMGIAPNKSNTKKDPTE